MEIGFSELLVILLIVFVLFGAGKLPKVMGDLGRGMKAFKEAARSDEAGTPTATDASRYAGNAAGSQPIPPALAFDATPRETVQTVETPAETVPAGGRVES